MDLCSGVPRVRLLVGGQSLLQVAQETVPGALDVAGGTASQSGVQEGAEHLSHLPDALRGDLAVVVVSGELEAEAVHALLVIQGQDEGVEAGEDGQGVCAPDSSALQISLRAPGQEWEVGLGVWELGENHGEELGAVGLHGGLVLRQGGPRAGDGGFLSTGETHCDKLSSKLAAVIPTKMAQFHAL